MNMRELEVISEIVNYQSFSDAAYSLSYSPSAISKYVSSVEEELGIKLFVRGSKSSELSLTAEGRVLMQDIQQINIDYQHMMEMARQLRDPFDNILRVGSQARLGNWVEQEVLASFLLQNDRADMEQIKLTTRDLLRLLQAGKIDAMFASIPENARIEDFFHDKGEYPDIEIVLLAVERDIYLGICDRYLPGVQNEAKFAQFKEFAFAFAFPGSSDQRDSRAIEPFHHLARQNGFQLKTAYFGAHDSTILKLAAKMPIAVATTSVPAQFEGIKFLRVSDWNAYTNLYFLCLKSNHKKMLSNLKKSVADYIRLADGAESAPPPGEK